MNRLRSINKLESQLNLALELFSRIQTIEAKMFSTISLVPITYFIHFVFQVTLNFGTFDMNHFLEKFNDKSRDDLRSYGSLIRL